MKIDMGRMNSARVDLKHHANHPDRDGVEDHFRNGRAFPGKVTAQYFSPLDFERLSIVSLVQDGEVRARLGVAKGQVKNDDLPGCVDCVRSSLRAHQGAAGANIHHAAPRDWGLGRC